MNVASETCSQTSDIVPDVLWTTTCKTVQNEQWLDSAKMKTLTAAGFSS